MEPLVESTSDVVERPETVCETCGANVQGVVLAGVAIPLRFCQTCAEAQLAADLDRLRVKLTAQALDRAGATTRLRDLTLESHPDDAARTVGADWLAAYRAGTRRNLWLYGPVGTRKTGLAWGIARELALDAVDRYFALGEEYRPDEPAPAALFVVWRDLYDDVVASFDAQRRAVAGDAADPSFLLLSARRIPVLCLDDLGAGRAPTPYALEQLEILVDRRYQAQLPTIITTNLASPQELSARLGHADAVAGARIVSRLLEDAVLHGFVGRNVRRPAT